MGVTTATVPSATFVASHDPPIPTSTTATSTGASAKAAKAMPTTVSKNDSGWRWSASTRSRYAARSTYACAKASSVSGSPSRVIRSVIDSTCGLVKRPVRRPRARSRSSTIRAVVVLPLVPVRWTTG